jgi:hypothetical protein
MSMFGQRDEFFRTHLVAFPDPQDVVGHDFRHVRQIIVLIARLVKVERSFVLECRVFDLFLKTENPSGISCDR